MVAAYKTVRQTVQQGDLYRLIRPTDPSGRAATFYVSPDKRQAVLFAFLHSSTKLDRQPRIQVTGLDPARQYRVTRHRCRVRRGRSGAERRLLDGTWRGCCP